MRLKKKMKNVFQTQNVFQLLKILSERPGCDVDSNLE